MIVHKCAKLSYIPLKKRRNRNAKSCDTGNAMIAIPDAIISMYVQLFCRLLSYGGNSNGWQPHTSSGLCNAMLRSGLCGFKWVQHIISSGFISLQGVNVLPLHEAQIWQNEPCLVNRERKHWFQFLGKVLPVSGNPSWFGIWKDACRVEQDDTLKSG